MLSGIEQYPPDELVFKINTIVSTTAPFQMLSNDPSRRYARIVARNEVQNAGQFLSIGGIPITSDTVPGATSLLLELIYVDQLNFCTQQINGNGFLAGNHYDVIEITYYPMKRGVMYDATRKPETLAVKVQRLSKSLWSGSK